VSSVSWRSQPTIGVERLKLSGRPSVRPSVRPPRGVRLFSVDNTSALRDIFVLSARISTKLDTNVQHMRENC